MLTFSRYLWLIWVSSTVSVTMQEATGPGYEVQVSSMTARNDQVVETAAEMDIAKSVRAWIVSVEVQLFACLLVWLDLLCLLSAYQSLFISFSYTTKNL